MRDLTLLGSLVLLVACGGAAEPPLDDDGTGGGETIERCAGPSTSRPETLDGRWFIAEIDDEDVELILDLANGTGTASSPEHPDRPALRVTVGSAADGMKQIVLHSPDGQEDLSLLWVFDGPGRALVFRPGDDDLAVARQAAPVPAELDGRWIAEEPDGDEPMELTIAADRITVGTESGSGAGQAWGLVDPHGSLDLALVIQTDGRRPEALMMSIRRIGGGAYVAWPQGDDEVRILYRPGARPAWMGPPGGRAEGAVDEVPVMAPAP